MAKLQALPPGPVEHLYVKWPPSTEYGIPLPPIIHDHRASTPVPVPVPVPMSMPLPMALGRAGGWSAPWDWKKPTIFERLFGGRKVEWDDADLWVGQNGYGYPHRWFHQRPRSRSVTVPRYGAPLPPVDDPDPSVSEGPVSIPPGMTLPQRLTPLPSNWWELSQAQQRGIIRERKEEIKRWKQYEKAEIKAYERALKQRDKVEKAKARAERATRRDKERDFLWRLKHPNNTLPYVGPGSVPVNPAAPTDPSQSKPESKLKTSKDPGQPRINLDPMTFMLLPTGEEFGVRRPFDETAAWTGRPPALGGTGNPWPMMSRTLTKAIVDMNREEQIHHMHAGMLRRPNNW
ncbi:hypothetical protein IAU60_005181 [Kwoniella sp. DSM 27419]